MKISEIFNRILQFTGDYWNIQLIEIRKNREREVARKNSCLTENIISCSIVQHRIELGYKPKQTSP